MATSISDGFQHPLGNGFLTQPHFDRTTANVKSGVSLAPDGVRDGYYIATDFGSKEWLKDHYSYHLGEDWNGDDFQDLKDPVFAASNGKIDQIGYLDGLGNYMTIIHTLPYYITYNGTRTNTIVTLYAHLNNDLSDGSEVVDGFLLKSGTIVTKGQQIGNIGKSGGDYEPHLHFEVRLGTAYKDADGYNRTTGSPTGWADPTNFINAYRNLGGTPDLTAEDVKIADSTPAANQTTTVTFDIFNIGTANAGPSVAGIYLSTDTNITTSDTWLGGLSFTKHTAGAHYNDASTSITLPSWVVEGKTYYIGVIADYNNAITNEKSETNNASTSTEVVKITISGGSLFTSGNDTVTMSTPGTVRALGGNDRVYGTSGTDVIYGDAGADFLKGNAGNDYLYGGTENDTLVGWSGNDVLRGDSGNDYLHGNSGTDYLYGGTGSDQFYFYNTSDRDNIRDFQDNIDTLVLQRSLWGGTNLSVSQVLNKYGIDKGSYVVLDFDNNEYLEIRGISSLNQLLDDIAFV